MRGEVRSTGVLDGVVCSSMAERVSWTSSKFGLSVSRIRSAHLCFVADGNPALKSLFGLHLLYVSFKLPKSF
jgi:type IV secretory pathway TrbD component